MGIVSQDAINQFQALMDRVEEPLKRTFQNVHQGYPAETLVRFLRAREGNVTRAHKMKPIIPADLYRAVRDSQLIGLSAFACQQTESVNHLHLTGYSPSDHQKERGEKS